LRGITTVAGPGALADEPTGQLDRATGDHVVSVLLAAADELDAALVVATHDPAVAERLSARWRMRDGRLLAEDRRAGRRAGRAVGAGRRVPAMTLTWLIGLLRRRGARLGGTSAGVAIAVALLGSLGAFLASSTATMTDRALRQVAVDWQVQVQPAAQPGTVLDAAAGQRAGPPTTRTPHRRLPPWPITLHPRPDAPRCWPACASIPTSSPCWAPSGSPHSCR
jgi:hypothetical protein